MMAMKNLIKTALRHSGITGATVLLGLTDGHLLAAENETSAQSNGVKVVDPEVTGVETAVLAQAPNVAPPLTRKAQRDYFGAHTYERIDAKGTFHTEWEKE